MNQYEKEIQALKYRCRKLEQQCSMFDDTFQKQNHLLFLHDLRVPATNNEAERLLRNYKRKQAQAVTFRSFESIDYLCQCMSMLVLMRLEDPANIYDRVSRIFG